MVDKRSNMQLSDLDSKPRGGKILRDIIYRAIVFRVYSPPVSEHYTIHCLDKFLGSTHINDKHSKNDYTKIT